jgi:hypothetical protein
MTKLIDEDHDYSSRSRSLCYHQFSSHLHIGFELHPNTIYHFLVILAMGISNNTAAISQDQQQQQHHRSSSSSCIIASPEATSQEQQHHQSSSSSSSSSITASPTLQNGNKSKTNQPP